MTDSRERRAHPRVPYGAWATVVQGGAKSFFLAQNLSLGGVFLRAELVPDLGSELELLLVVEGEKAPIAAQGTVVRHDAGEGGFGVRFDAMSEDAAAALLDLVQAIAKRSPADHDDEA